MKRSLAAALALLSGAAAAVSPDLKVSTDDLNEAGEHAVELQVNRGTGAPLHFLGEYSRGITDAWQVAAKLPFAREGGIHALGGVLELRYLGPHDRSAGGYWGADFSVGRERDAPGGEPVTGFELQPVAGYRSKGWHLAANAAIALPASGPDRSATFAFQSKAARRIGRHELGLEYYRHADRSRHLFVAWDRIYGSELGIALGRGLTDASERWILKAVCSFPLR